MSLVMEFEEIRAVKDAVLRMTVTPVSPSDIMDISCALAREYITDNSLKNIDPKIDGYVKPLSAPLSVKSQIADAIRSALESIKHRASPYFKMGYTCFKYDPVGNLLVLHFPKETH